MKSNLKVEIEKQRILKNKIKKKQIKYNKNKN